jgi:HlyD family secretion protein
MGIDECPPSPVCPQDRLPDHLAGRRRLIFLLRMTVFAPDPIEVVSPRRTGHGQSTLSNSKAAPSNASPLRIAAEIGGRVVEIRHREKAHVKAASFSSGSRRRACGRRLEQVKEGVASPAGLEDACLRRDRPGASSTGRSASPSENVTSEDRLDALRYGFDSARVACEAAKAELAQAKANLRAAESELAKTSITAPFDGIVAEVNVEMGEWVTPSPPLLTSPAVIDLIDPTSIYVSAPMDEVVRAPVRPGLPVRVVRRLAPGSELPGA